MAWIESHQALGQHPKTQQLATLLKVSLPTAVGHLHYFWWWALDFAPTGAIPNPTPAVVAHAAQWKGNADRFWLAMVQAGFVDVNEECVSIHDWLDYAGRLLEKRVANRERQRKHRNAENGVTSRVTNALVTGLPTGPTNQPDTNQPTGTQPTLPPYPPSDQPNGGNGVAGISTACCTKYASTGNEHLASCPTRVNA